MIKFKKAMAVIMASAMCMGVGACGKSEVATSDSTSESTTASSDSATGNDAADASSSDANSSSKETSLKGTGPATKEEAFAGGDTGSAQLKDGDVLVDINFDDGTVNNFVTYTNGGSFELKNEDGQLVADIKNCGSLDYANQTYWDGFALSEHCVYTYSFDISSDIERQVEYRL